MSFVEPVRPYIRPLSASALIVLLGLGAMLLHGYTSLQSQSRQLDLLGQTLAQSAAQRAVDATLSQDMLSLRASLQDLTRHPQVVGATIHDVENRLLVQSGFGTGQFQASDYRRYSAAVALDDKVAGHLQLTLKPARFNHWDWQFFGLWGLLVALAGLWRWWSGTAPPASPSDTAQQDVPANQSQAQLQAQIQLRLRLQLINLNPLFNQLNRDSFHRQLGVFEQQLKDVMGLYGGRFKAQCEETLLIDFSGEQTSDCAFRALCSAQLLGELSHLNPGPRLRLAARVHGLPTAANPHPKLAQAFVLQQHTECPSQASGIAIAPELIDKELQQHLEVDIETGLLVGVKAPYRQLLDRQQKHLQSTTR